MFSRWSQENFFRYMRQSYNLDGLIDYGTEGVPETTMVVNPAHRTLDGQVRKKVGVLSRKIAEFGAINLEGEIEPCKVEAFAQRKSDLQESITQLQNEVDTLKAQRKATPRHIPFKDLPEEARFDRLCVPSTARGSISSRICRPRPSRSVSTRSPIHHPTKPSDTFAPSSTLPRRCFPVPNCA